ncbi:Gfo/Idh/MocA family protein [Phenylobacterium sp.]|uniref:Gfo/Idh/MocA family protein n=1 Tax=Phenylobacterium sp. TaxID=1871053 RepID=UPI0017932692|nr:Gfo/Idh/MocA family oxidoreductase [Phenylobacterium sp.]MBA4792214.1 Gfo/Idh/MocA family oxidoreductase [Phenylobacterium sp.]MBC7169018.1 Gfo/Idh/MocA family oxidoreductase [Phenylobacterium sp.]
MTKQGLVVVGPGLMGRKHIELIQNNPRSELAGIVTPERAVFNDIGERLNVPLFHDLETCLDSLAPSGVIISSPNEFHYDQARLCVERDVPALVEKPITSTYEDAARLADLVARRNAKLIVGHHRAHSPLMSTAKTLIEEGRLGRLVAIQGSAIFHKPPEYFEAGPWRREIGGGPILINLIHEIGIMRTLCGEISAVQAIASNAIRGFPVEDTVAINLQFRSGALGTFVLSDTGASPRSWEQTSRENPVYPTYPDEDCYSITGTQGSLDFPTMRLKSHPASETPSWHRPFVEEVIPVVRADPLERQLDNFIDVILGRGEPVVTAFDGAQNLKVADAIRRSAETSTLVALDS